MIVRGPANEKGFTLMNEQGLENVLAVIASHIGAGEMTKAMGSFPRDMQPLFPALASAA